MSPRPTGCTTREVGSELKGENVASGTKIEILDQLFCNAQIVDVFRLREYTGWFGVKNSQFAYVEEGDPSSDIQAEEIIDCQGLVVIPGLIDTHMHIESSLLLPNTFAQAVVPHGTTTVLADPHEVANVAGEDGVRWFMRISRDLTLRIYWAIPSVVPIVSSEVETPNATLDPNAIEKLCEDPSVLSLGEIHDYRGVAAGDEIALALGEISQRTGLKIEGHNPSLLGMDLSRYARLGAVSDHTLTSPKKLLEELSKGFFVMLQRKSLTKENIKTIQGLRDKSRILLVTDDVAPSELRMGHLSVILSTAIQQGMPPVEAIASATIRPASYLGFHRLGAIAPGRWADFALLESVSQFPPRAVYVNGKLVGQNGQAVPGAFWDSVPEISPPQAPAVPGPFELNDFRLVPNGEGLQHVTARVIALLNNENTVAGLEIVHIDANNGFAQLEEELCLIGVFSRCNPSSRSLALLKGFGLTRGGYASSFAHDAHNLMVVGRDPSSLLTAANAVYSMGGGMAVAEGNDVIASLRLPVLGLLSDEGLETVVRNAEGMESALVERGASHKRPLLTLTFLALASSPYYKMSDKGIVDVEAKCVLSPYLEVLPSGKG